MAAILSLAKRLGLSLRSRAQTLISLKVRPAADRAR
jgi:hypothetical protein